MSRHERPAAATIALEDLHRAAFRLTGTVSPEPGAEEDILHPEDDADIEIRVLLIRDPGLDLMVFEGLRIQDRAGTPLQLCDAEGPLNEEETQVELWAAIEDTDGFLAYAYGRPPGRMTAGAAAPDSTGCAP